MPLTCLRVIRQTLGGKHPYLFSQSEPVSTALLALPLAQTNLFLPTDPRPRHDPLSRFSFHQSDLFSLRKISPSRRHVSTANRH